MTEISDNNNNKSNEKALRETQTLRARHRVHDGCSKAGPTFSPRRRPFPGRAGPPKFNQLQISTFTCRPSLVKIDARNFELSW